MKTILALLFSALVAIGAPGDFLFTKIGTPNTPVLLTPVNGQVLVWSGTTIGNLDIAGTYAPLASPTFTGTVSTGNLTTGGLLTFGTGTSFAFATGLDSGLRYALGLGALSTVTPGTNVATALAIAADATGGIFRQGQALAASTVTASGAVRCLYLTGASGDFTSVLVGHHSSPTALIGDGGTLGFKSRKGFKIGWSNSTSSANQPYLLALDVASDTAVEINNGTAGTLRDVALRNLTASGTVTAAGKISASVPAYANDAAADADAALLSGQFYKITGSRAVYQKP